MKNIIYLMGKSAAGKDTIYKRLLEDSSLRLQRVVPYTTRPMRAGEQEGVEYFFTTEEQFRRYFEEGKIIEAREYHTVQGIWRYYTVEDEQFCQQETPKLLIGTLEGYEKVKEYFGEDRLLPIMIELDDGLRLERALRRERQQERPDYKELCRRFLADAEDFSEEKIQRAGITKRFQNVDLEKCMEEIKQEIQKIER